MQEVSEMRLVEYEECRRRLGVRNESVWLARTAGFAVALAYLEVDDAERLVSALAVSGEPFDVWLKARLAEFHGGDLTRRRRGPVAELLFSHEETRTADEAAGSWPDGHPAHTKEIKEKRDT